MIKNFPKTLDNSQKFCLEEKYYLVLQLANSGSRIAHVVIKGDIQLQSIKVAPISMEERTLVFDSPKPLELYVNINGSSIPAFVKGKKISALTPTRTEEVHVVRFGEGMYRVLCK